MNGQDLGRPKSRLKDRYIVPSLLLLFCPVVSSCDCARCSLLESAVYCATDIEPTVIMSAVPIHRTNKPILCVSGISSSHHMRYVLHIERVCLL